MHSKKNSESDQGYRPAINMQEKGSQDWSHYFEKIQRE